MWHSPLDFSYLDRQEQQQQQQHPYYPYAGNLAHQTNPDQKLRVEQKHDYWYVLLLLDIHKKGHTNLVKTTTPGIFNQAADSGAAHPPRAATSTASFNSSPTDPKSWRAVLAIDVGYNEAEADAIIDRISASSNGKKQVRGGLQRGIRGDLVSTWWGKSVFADLCALLNITPKEMEEQVQVVPYSLVSGALGAGAASTGT